MKILYSNMLPLGTEPGQESILDCFHTELQKADAVDIAVGYVSSASLKELDRLLEADKIGYVCLIMGMYYVEGMPESSYHTAVAFNKKWMKKGCGEIRVVKTLKYHGKVYCFYKDDNPFSTIIGSANLGVLKLDANNRRQYEMAAYFDDVDKCQEVSDFMKKVKRFSFNLSDITDMKLIRELNTSLSEVESVTLYPQNDIKYYNAHKTDISFVLPIKVPSEADKLKEGRGFFTKSNINVCYAAPRNKKRSGISRDWFETQMTVNVEITGLPGYPEKNVPFFVITDDGYWFKAHTTSSNNKQFSAVNDEKIMGRWLKGRLAAAGLVTPVNNTQKDTKRTGMITKEMLAAYGADGVVFTKTNKKALDENGKELDVWCLEFKALTQEDKDKCI